ncbi:GNAT family N-acetyltransferase [Actinacidiphila epipremni]|jgi:GNAT superfamily N-acetyltransferase|uniref:GNAT family N-acetyltransferase n=1 Tax=Actinacidiphila epipremni TaxID=2053013 RepID=A0ABX0ZNQ7_9ACTN|nr:GNAT family N-acetyltransferase [Actinacidiphila epipremni]NJP45529.1 GNAT family N-acetyltransferase [Actinacidiphila epipremni]
MAVVEIRTTRYDDAAAVRLDGLVQLEYAERYGEGDLTPMAADHFDPPHGLYLVAFDADGEPVASGGWRAQEASPEGHEDGDAEIKRMFVVRERRGQGLARRILAELEATAAAAGRRRMVLETGSRQPEAIALYTSCGYVPVKKFGYYRHEELSICMGKPLTAPLPVAPRG